MRFEEALVALRDDRAVYRLAWSSEPKKCAICKDTSEGFECLMVFWTYEVADIRGYDLFADDWEILKEGGA